MTDAIVISHFGYFLAFYPPNTPLTPQKIKILIKQKKIPEDIIILHKCTKNYDQVMYSP